MNKIRELAQMVERRIQWLCTITKTLNFKRKSYCAFTLSSNDNNKNYNFLDSNWFKKLLFSTNSLAQVVIGQFVIRQFNKAITFKFIV